MKKIIYNITPFTTTDYKDHLSCIVWFISCNMRCQYCYNKDIVDAKAGEYTIEDLFDFLKRRIGLLDAVVLSGGEATCHNLFDICKDIKELGFNIKLDTNGSNPKQISKLLENNLLDFVALDFKSHKESFKKITNSNFYKDFLKTFKLLKNSNTKYEIRTTLHADFLKEKDINEMQTILIKNDYHENYYIQNFLNVENMANLTSSNYYFDKTKLNSDLNIIFRN